MDGFDCTRLPKGERSDKDKPRAARQQESFGLITDSIIERYGKQMQSALLFGTIGSPPTVHWWERPNKEKVYRYVSTADKAH